MVGWKQRWHGFELMNEVELCRIYYVRVDKHPFEYDECYKFSTATCTLQIIVFYISAISNIAAFGMPRPSQVTCAYFTEHLPSSCPTTTSITICRLRESLIEKGFILRVYF